MMKQWMPQTPERIGLAVTLVVLLIGSPWAIEGLTSWLEFAMSAATPSTPGPWHAFLPIFEVLALWVAPALGLGALSTWVARRKFEKDPEHAKESVPLAKLSADEQRQELASTLVDLALRGVGYSALIAGAVLFLMELINQSAWRQVREVGESMGALDAVLMTNGARGGLALMVLACVCAVTHLLRKRRVRKGEVRIHRAKPVVYASESLTYLPEEVTEPEEAEAQLPVTQSVGADSL